MYNYFKDKYLTDIYDYLVKRNMLNSFIKSVVSEDKDYKRYIKLAKEYKNKHKSSK
jgi:hypothetical protein